MRLPSPVLGIASELSPFVARARTRLNVMKKISANEFEASTTPARTFPSSSTGRRCAAPVARRVASTSISLAGWSRRWTAKPAPSASRDRRWSSCGSPSGSTRPRKHSGLRSVCRRRDGARRARREGEKPGRGGTRPRPLPLSAAAAPGGRALRRGRRPRRGPGSLVGPFSARFPHF